MNNNGTHHSVRYKLWFFRVLRTLVKDFPKVTYDPVHSAEEFNLVIQTYEPVCPNLYQLIQHLVGEGQASHWYATVGWNNPLDDIHRTLVDAREPSRNTATDN